jgi:hypothetical protein
MVNRKPARQFTGGPFFRREHAQQEIIPWSRRPRRPVHTPRAGPLKLLAFARQFDYATAERGAEHAPAAVTQGLRGEQPCL